MEVGNYEEALRAFEEAKKLYKDPSIELSLAATLLKLRRFEEAKPRIKFTSTQERPTSKTKRRLKTPSSPSSKP